MVLLLAHEGLERYRACKLCWTVWLHPPYWGWQAVVSRIQARGQGQPSLTLFALAASDAGSNGVTGPTDVVGGAAELVGNPGGGLTLDVEADGFGLVLFAQALVAHLNTGFFEDAEDSTLAETVGLHELPGALADFVVSGELLEGFGWEAMVQFVDESRCRPWVGCGFVTVRGQMAFQVTESRRNRGEMF